MLTKEEIKHKIDYEIVVDCYDDEEVSMGWYYSLDEELEFPFEATAQLKKRDGSMEEKRVKIVGLHSKENGFKDQDFMLEMESGDNIVPIAYSKLRDIEASEESLDILQCWDFWVKGG